MCVPRAKEATAQTRELRLSRLVSLVPPLSDLAFLIPILVLFWCTTGVGWLLTDSDTGWHIRAGEWMLKNGRVPSADLFSFTKAGQAWFAWEWLSEQADSKQCLKHSRNCSLSLSGNYFLYPVAPASQLAEVMPLPLTVAVTRKSWSAARQFVAQVGGTRAPMPVHVRW